MGAAKKLALFMAAAMLIDNTQTACASSQADFDVELYEELLPEEELLSEELLSEEPELLPEIPEETTKESSEESAEELVLTEEELEIKTELAENDVLSELLEMEEGTDYVEDQVITLASSEEEAGRIARAYGGELIDYSYGLATISLEDSGLSVVDAFEYGIDPDSNVPAVEANIYMSFEEEYGDFENWSEEYYVAGNDDPMLKPTDSKYQWYHEALGSFYAWELTKGSSDIVVAVIDSGVQTDHEDLKDAIVDNYEQVNQDTYDMGLNDSNEDGYGHGTHVAGLVAASIGNDLGGAGVAPGAKILPINVCRPSKPSSPVISYMVKAIQYVAGAVDGESGTYYKARRADIINMSIGSNTYSAAMKTALDAAYAQGVTVVAAMGNDGSNLVKYPARYEHTIGVCATKKDNTLAEFSNYGDWADISAPGAGIYSSLMGSGSTYGSKDGTSMASPIVAGACALYMSYVGHVSPDAMLKVLKNSATKATQPGMGAGVVNVAAMLGKKPKDTGIDSANGTVEIITLDQKSITLSSPAAGIADYAELGVGTIEYRKNSDGVAVGDINYTLFKWSSSNTKVVKISGDSEGYGLSKVELEPVGPGTATVTCQPLDSSGKKATCKVKVLSDKAVTGIRILSDTSGSYITSDSSGKIKEIVLFNNSPEPAEDTTPGWYYRYPSLVVYAQQTTKDGDFDDYIKAPVFKNSNSKVVRIDQVGNSGKEIRITALSKGTAKITATSTDGSGKSTTIKITVKQPVTGLELSGQSYIQAGTKASFKAKVLPTNANVKTLRWEVGAYNSETGAIKNVPGVTVTSSGKVSVTKGLNYSGDITVRVSSLDNSNIKAMTTFNIAQKATNVTLYNPNAGAGSDWTTLIPVSDDNENNYEYDSTLTLVGAAYSPDSRLGKKVSFTSSNPGVARVVGTSFDSETGRTTATIRAFSKGKTTITCKALDGSKKSNKINLKVIIPVSGLYLTIKDNQSNYMAYGATATVNAVVGKAYGTPDNTGVIWDYDIVGYKEPYGSGKLSKDNPELLETIKKNKAFFTFSNGKVKVDTKEKFMDDLARYGYDNNGDKIYKDFGLVVYATPADGSHFKAESSIFRGKDPGTKIEFIKYTAGKNSSGDTVYTAAGAFDDTIVIDLDDELAVPTVVGVDENSQVENTVKYPVSVYSLDTTICSAYYGTRSNAAGIIIYPYKEGTAKITVSLRDGSGFSKTLNVQVIKKSSNQ